MDAAQKERILEEDYGLAMEQELEKELKQMCNLSEAIEEKALEKGLKKGIKQGFSRGKDQGIAKGKTCLLYTSELTSALVYSFISAVSSSLPGVLKSNFTIRKRKIK